MIASEGSFEDNLNETTIKRIQTDQDDLNQSEFEGFKPLNTQEQSQPSRNIPLGQATESD